MLRLCSPWRRGRDQRPGATATTTANNGAATIENRWLACPTATESLARRSVRTPSSNRFGAHHQHEVAAVPVTSEKPAKKTMVPTNEATSAHADVLRRSCLVAESFVSAPMARYTLSATRL